MIRRPPRSPLFPSTTLFLSFHADKRTRILHSEANLIELDLLRAGRRMPLSKPYPPGHYTLVSRSPLQPKCEVDRKSTRLNSSHANISYAVFCLKKKKPVVVN